MIRLGSVWQQKDLFKAKLPPRKQGLIEVIDISPRGTLRISYAGTGIQLYHSEIYIRSNFVELPNYGNEGVLDA